MLSHSVSSCQQIPLRDLPVRLLEIEAGSWEPGRGIAASVETEVESVDCKDGGERQSQDQRGGMTQGAWKLERCHPHPPSLTKFTRCLKPVDWVLYPFLRR